MQVYDEKAYEWNHAVAPEGNMGKVHPQELARLLNANEIPWYTSGWPYSSGLVAYCDDDLWKKLTDLCRW